MKFSIGYNHDIKLLDLLDVYKDNIEALYFPIPHQYLSSGRLIPQKNSYLNEIPEIIKKCNSLNIKSQLLLNATYEGELGLEKKFFSKIIDYIQKLKSLGLKSVIVTNPVYISEIKERIKEIEVESSVNCYVKTIEHALYLKDLGVDILTIDRDINRDISLIKEIKDKTGLKIRILLNEGCLRNCPFRKMHFNLIAHTKSKLKTEMISGIFFEKWCMKIYSQNPAKIFSVPFIPPDALKYYIQFVDYFKISCRDSSNSLIEFRLKAYINQS
jgi:collagenase-like PrtC family protease